MSNFLDEKREEIQARMRELEPLVAEYRELEAAASALADVAPASPPRARAARTTKTTAARKPAAAKKPGAAKRGRPRGSGARAKQALDIVTAKPGITIPDLAEKMGIKQNYLYRVMPGLEKDGKVVRRDRGWHPVK